MSQSAIGLSFFGLYLVVVITIGLISARYRKRLRTSGSPAAVSACP